LIWAFSDQKIRWFEGITNLYTYKEKFKKDYDFLTLLKYALNEYEKINKNKKRKKKEI
jgi:hypothetical protein